MGASTGTARPIFDRAAAVTRSLLGYGVVVGPFYLLVGILQGIFRPGFSFARHPLSVLANGSFGWVQTINFALSGIMVVAAAVGMKRVVGRGSGPTFGALVVFGVGVFLAAIFRADPMDGFPIGTPSGMPTSMTTRGMMHFVVSMIAFTSFGVSAILASRMFSRREENAMSRLSLVSGIVVLLTFYAGSALNPVVGIWISVVVGWTWFAVISLHLYRRSPSPNCVAAERR